MQVNKGHIALSTADLVAHAACEHLTVLDWQQHTGQPPKPYYYDPLTEIRERRAHDCPSDAKQCACKRG